MKDNDRTATSLMVETSPVACRLPFGTILFLQPATYRLGPQHLQSPFLPRSLTAMPAVAASIVWETAYGAYTWGSWPRTLRWKLRQAFDLAWAGSSIRVPLVPGDLLPVGDN